MRARSQRVVALSAALFSVLVIACGASATRPRSPAVALNEQGYPAWLEEAAARCVRIASCSLPEDTPRLRDPSACIDWWVARIRSVAEPVHHCLAAANTCDEISACVRDKPDAQAAAYCALHEGALGGCDGNRLVSCGAQGHEGHGDSTSTDCGTLSARCEEKKAAGGLVVRACFSSSQCLPGAPEARCDGASRIVVCHDGAVEHSQCGPGTRCELHRDQDGELAPTCEPISAGKDHVHCEAVGRRHCAEDRLVECVAHGHFGDVRVSDCASLGLRCQGRGEKSACVVDPHAECEPGPARCEGEAVTFCAAGHPEKISCRALGMGPCDPSAHGPAAGCRGKNASSPPSDAGSRSP